MALLYYLPDQTPALHTEIGQRLQTGLRHLSQVFPWLAARVITLGASSTNTGENHFAPHLDAPTLVIKDLSHDESVYSFTQMSDRKFPMEMLSEEIFAPIPTIGASESELGRDAPVFAVQCTFVKGGVVLVVVGEHRCMDGIGMGSVIKLLDKACKGIKFTEEEIEVGNMERSGLVLLNEESVGDDDGELRNQPARETEKPAKMEVKGLKWFSFHFSEEAQAKIKALATPKDRDGEKEGWISTDDALTAFIFHHITQARSPILRDTDMVPPKLARAVDIRHLFNVSATYPGMFQSMTYHTYPPTNTSEATPLQELAVSLRRALHPSTSTLKEDSQIMLCKIDQTSDKSKISLTPNFIPSRDFMLSSWGKMGLANDVNFGIANGGLKAVRRPSFMKVEGLGYFLPADEDGARNVVVCLGLEDGERMMTDKEWREVVDGGM